MNKLLLLRYDTEGTDTEQMKGFLEKALNVHREHAIPATFFCMGKALDVRGDDFRAFGEAVKDDPLFDLQDHSYSHIGLGYEAGKPIDVLKADYEKSFASHEHIFGKRPAGISRCGTSGRDGERLAGWDQTEKGLEEFRMITGLGIKMLNTLKPGIDETRTFINYGHLDAPDVMGFISGHSDTEWMYQHSPGDALDYITGLIRERADAGEHLPVMLHDWCAWDCAGDKELTHVIKIAETARAAGFTMATHMDCYENKSLWQN